MKLSPLPILCVTVQMGLAPLSWGQELSASNIAIHIGSHSSPGTICTTSSPVAAEIPCSLFRTEEQKGSAYDIYVVPVMRDTTRGISGVTLGIQYGGLGQGLVVQDWFLCADSEITTTNPSWPISGSGNRITWDAPGNCQGETIPGSEEEGALAVAGAFYVYAYDTSEMTTWSHPESLFYAVTDCAGVQDVYPNLMANRLTFSPQLPDPGCNPCVVEPCGWIDPVDPTTWGGLKSLFSK